MASSIVFQKPCAFGHWNFTCNCWLTNLMLGYHPWGGRRSVDHNRWWIRMDCARIWYRCRYLSGYTDSVAVSTAYSDQPKLLDDIVLLPLILSTQMFLLLVGFPQPAMNLSLLNRSAISKYTQRSLPTRITTTISKKTHELIYPHACTCTRVSHCNVAP